VAVTGDEAAEEIVLKVAVAGDEATAETVLKKWNARQRT
jgi:hypothetical protein